MLKIFIVLFSFFLRQKVTINGKVTFADSVFRIRLRTAPNWPKIQKMTMTSQFSGMTSSLIFWRCFISLVKFSYWSKFHISIITGSGIMTILFYKGLTKKPEIGNTPDWVLLSIGGRLDAEFSTNVSNRIFLNAAKCQRLQLLPFFSY